MTTRSISGKMGMHKEMRILLTDAPETAVDAMELPVTPEKKLTGKFDLLHVFVSSMRNVR